MDHVWQKHRQGLEPTQRRVRHIRCIMARNLTFTENANQRTLASVLVQPTPQFLAPNHHARSLTPSIELGSGSSSPSRSYFRASWKNYQYGVPRVRGPGSETGSVTASESGRTSVLKEPIARLSAGLKASVLSVALESGYISESNSATGSGIGDPGKKSRYRTSKDFPVLKGKKGLPTMEDQTEHTYSASVPNTPPPSLIRDRHLSPHQDPVKRNATTPDNSTSIQISRPKSTELSLSQVPAFAKNKPCSSRLVLDTYFTLHDPNNDNVIYTSDTVIGSNNPKYSALEGHRFLDETKQRSSSVVVRIWAGWRGSEFSALLEWRVELCCLRYIGRELRDLPGGLPNNTILFEFEDGLYTAPDDDDMLEPPQSGMPMPNSIGSQGSKQSYTYESVMRLNNLHECIADTKKSRDEIKHNIEQALCKDNAPMIMQKRRGECTERLWHLQRQVGHELNVLEQAQDKAAALRQEHIERRKALAESRERGQMQESYLEENMANLIKNKESLLNTRKEYWTKRTELIATLFTVFPITESEGDPSLLMISNVPLPNSVYIGVDEDLISVALGLTCHLVTMLAHYLSVPLRYPLTPMGSRASVLDPVSLLVGPKEFPLYGKGQDRNRFEYGVFLLNKDIEQLMNSQGLQFMDLRQTLPNLRYLMETLLTASPIIEKYRTFATKSYLTTIST